MKKILSLISFSLLCIITANAEGIYSLPLIHNVQAYESMSLNGEWKYIVDVQEEGYYDYRRKPYSQGFFCNAKPQRPEDLIEYDFESSPSMQIPSDWNTQDERLFFYEGTVWFKKSFQAVPSDEYRSLLYFGAVNYDCRVWLNGKELGHHIGGFTPFNYDVSNVIKEGENTIVVKVDNKRHAEDVPTQIFDWWNYGGITRDVMLVKVPHTYLEDYRLELSKANKPGKKEIVFSAKTSKAEAGHTIILNIAELGIKKKLTTDNSGYCEASFNLPIKTNDKPKGTRNKQLELWSPTNPKLYSVDITLDNSTINDEIGFRTVETRGKKILLNGEPVFLKGVSIHEEKPNGGGRANSVEDARTLLSWAKELGCNYVRLAHYPHNEHMVREAERLGIMVWSEIPVYWTIAWNNPQTLNNARNQLHDMIARDHNRANIIIWSIANETPHSAERDAFLGNLAEYARSLDSTRLISMAMEVVGADNYVNRLNDDMNKYVDVVSFNQYIGWYRDVNDASKMTWEIPYDKPVIISEFGGGAKYGYHGPKNQRWTEEFQENLYRENTAMLDKIDGLAGTSPWILKDFRSPRRVLPGIQDFYNMKGLLSDKGEKKKAFFVLKEWYKNK